MFYKKNFKKPQSSSQILIYGKHSVISAINNPKRKCKNLYITKATLDELKFKTNHLNVIICDKRELDAMLPVGSNHQNIILEALALQSPDIEDIIEHAGEASCLVILDQVTDPHNVGAIMRSANAFAADAIILPENNAPKENATIVKCSAGASENLPLVYVTNLASTLKLLKQAGYWIIGLDGSAKQFLEPSIFSNKIAIILGSEDIGMRKLTRENCDYLVKIPMNPTQESLNVSNAAAIALYEFYKFSLANVPL